MTDRCLYCGYRLVRVQIPKVPRFNVVADGVPHLWYGIPCYECGAPITLVEILGEDDYLLGSAVAAEAGPRWFRELQAVAAA